MFLDSALVAWFEDEEVLSVSVEDGYNVKLYQSTGKLNCSAYEDDPCDPADSDRKEHETGHA